MEHSCVSSPTRRNALHNTAPGGASAHSSHTPVHRQTEALVRAGHAHPTLLRQAAKVKVMRAIHGAGAGMVGVWLFIFLKTALASEPALYSFEHRRWTGADAAPNQVGAIAQARDGHLWLGTNDSLYRFDGQVFKRYLPPDESPLGIVSALKAVEQGLWVGLRTGGVVFITDAGMTRHPAGNGLPGGVVYGVARDADGAVWVAANDGLGRFDGKQWQSIGADWNFPGQHARAVHVDRSGTLWAANEERLYYLPSGSRSFTDTGIVVDHANQIGQAPDGAIWVAERYSGVLRRIEYHDTVAVTATTVIEGASRLLFDSAGGIWVGTGGSGIRYTPPSPGDLPKLAAAIQPVQAFSTRDGLSADAVRAMFEDAEGNIWIGTSAGLDRLRPRATALAAFPRYALNFSLAPGPDGSLLAGTSNLPAMRLHGTDLVSLGVPAPVHSAISDSEGSAWLAGSHGIWRVRGDHAERVAALPIADEPDSTVRAMARDGAGKLWVSINRAGLYCLGDSRWTKMPAASPAPRQLMPVVASTDLQGRAWFGFRDNLVATYEAGCADGAPKIWDESDGLKIGHVTAMLHLGDRSWVGGQRGLAWFDGKRFHSLHLPDNGLFDNIYAIIAAPAHNAPDVSHYDLWLHSKGGIFQLTAAALRRALADPAADISYRSHDVIGGLPNDPHQVLPLPTAVRGSDGRLWFSTSAGVLSIDPTQHMPQRPMAGPVIESLTADGAEMPLGQPARLTARVRRIEIAYTALNLSGHPGIHFRYQLSGFDDEWQQVGNERQAVYHDLGPGDYVFRVRATNPDGVLSPEEATVRFSIPPAFYKQPLFMLLCGVALVAALLILHRIRLRRVAANLQTRLEERHAERERIARELHDTLLQGVHGLMMNVHAATESLPPMHPARRNMEHALDRADLVIIEARDRLADLRDTKDPALNLLAALANLASELQAKGGAAFAVRTQGSPQALHPIVVEESYRIGCEAIINAYRHSRATRIDVQLSYNKQAFRLTVSDNGKGIDPQYVPPYSRPGHWGLRGMSERASKIGAKLTLQNNSPRGTIVELTVPPAAAYHHRTSLGARLKALFGPGRPK